MRLAANLVGILAARGLLQIPQPGGHLLQELVGEFAEEIRIPRPPDLAQLLDDRRVENFVRQ